MKKILILVLTLLLALSVGTYFYLKRPKNIFGEMYQEVKGNYLGSNVFHQLNDVAVKNHKIYDKDMNETGKLEPVIIYSDYYFENYNTNLELRFNFYQGSKGVNVHFKENIESNIELNFNVHYTRKGKLLKKKLILSVGTENYTESREVKSYLKEHGITSDDLNNYYDEIVNQKVLKDWCSIYDSHFSPTDYGDVTVETQWEDW